MAANTQCATPSNDPRGGASLLPFSLVPSHQGKFPWAQIHIILQFTQGSTPVIILAPVTWIHLYYTHRFYGSVGLYKSFLHWGHAGLWWYSWKCTFRRRSYTDIVELSAEWKNTKLWLQLVFGQEGSQQRETAKLKMYSIQSPQNQRGRRSINKYWRREPMWHPWPDEPVGKPCGKHA